MAISLAQADHPLADRPSEVSPSLWTHCCAGSDCHKAEIAFIAERKQDRSLLVKVNGRLVVIPKVLVHYAKEGWVCTHRVTGWIRCLFMPPVLGM